MMTAEEVNEGLKTWHLRPHAPCIHLAFVRRTTLGVAFSFYLFVN